MGVNAKYSHQNEDPKNGTPYSGCEYSHSVDYRTLKWIYFLDPPRGSGRLVSDPCERVYTRGTKQQITQYATEQASTCPEDLVWRFLDRSGLCFFFLDIEDTSWTYLGNIQVLLWCRLQSLVPRVDELCGSAQTSGSRV